MLTDSGDEAGLVFEQHRPNLFALAYRMLSSLADAEDVVQEAYLRFARVNLDDIETPAAFLATIVTRLSIDRLRQLRAERARYIGPWLPEPLWTDQTMPADERSALAESLSQALLLLLETLDPIERAVFLLREVFDFEYDAIAAIVDCRSDHCRQLMHRARARVSAGKTRCRASCSEQRRLTERFLETCASGDLTGLMALLSDDVTFYSDSGGKVPAARRLVRGATDVARLFIGITKKKPTDMATAFATINDRPAFITTTQGKVSDVIQLEIVDGKITAIFVQRNPDKLRHIPVP